MNKAGTQKIETQRLILQRLLALIRFLGTDLEAARCVYEADAGITIIACTCSRSWR